jgi:hypothetical protein
MQDVSLEVESNILATYKLRGKYDRDRRKQKAEASSSDASGTNPQVDELTKLVKSLSVEMEKLKLEGRQANRNPKILEIETISEDKIIHLKFFREIREIERIKRFKPLSKTIWLMMKKEIMKKQIKKFIVWGTHLLPLI